MSGKKHQAFQGKECFSRMNFLYQASVLMAGSNNTLASYYGQLCRNIGKKAVLRIDPDIKRQLCKRCSLALQPGITAELKAVSRRRRRKKANSAENIDKGTSLQLTCRQCGFKRQYVVNPDYKFWLENEESVVESITVGRVNKEHKQIEATTSNKQSAAKQNKKCI